MQLRLHANGGGVAERARHYCGLSNYARTLGFGALCCALVTRLGTIVVHVSKSVVHSVFAIALLNFGSCVAARVGV